MKRARTTDHSHCCVPKCTSDKRYDIEDKISFHQFPKEETKKNQWIHKIRRDPGKYFKITRKAKVCSLHFRQDMIKKTPNGRRVLQEGAVPELFQWNNFTLSSGRKLPERSIVSPDTKELEAK